jgi:hypothetical protein
MNATTFAPATLHSNAATNRPALSPTHWHDGCTMEIGGGARSSALAPIAAAFNRGGADAVLVAARGGRDSYVSKAWTMAMSAVHGPRGVLPTEENKATAVEQLRAYLCV